MKVILFLFYSQSGMYHYCLSLADILARFCDVYLFLPKSASKYNQKRNMTIIFHDLPKLNNITSYIKIFNLITILRDIFQINPNIIHFPSTNHALLFLLPILKRKFPIVTTIHDPVFHPTDNSIKKQLTRKKTLNNSNSIIVHDKFGKAVLSRIISPKKVFLVRHISFESILKKFNSDLSHKTGDYILFFGRLHKYKGLEVLAKAAKKLQQSSPEIKIRIYGKGHLGVSENQFKECNNVQIKNRYINDSEIPHIFINSRFVVLPYTSATQSGIIPIAYYFGKPVLTTNVGGLPESVIEGKTGFIIQKNDSGILAEKMQYLWNIDDQIFTKFATNCKKWLEMNISPQEIAKKTIQVYLISIERFNQCFISS